MPEGYEGQADGQVAESSAPATGQSPDELGAQGEQGVEGSEQPERQAQPRTVPLHEHVGQRKQYQARLQQERERNDQLEARLARLEQGGRREGEVDPNVQKWKEYTGVSKLEAKLELMEQELAKRGGVDPELEARIERAEVAAQVATDSYFTDIENQAKAAYNPKDIPVDRATWEELVAAKMTPQETLAIARGDRRTFAAVIARAKAIFTKPGASPSNPQPQRNPSGQFVRRPPAAPGPGGSPPPAPAPEKRTGRALHDYAHQVFSGVRESER